MHMMSSTEWKSLPALVRRQRLIEVGLSAYTVEACTVVIDTGADLGTVPPRMIGAIRLRPGARLLYYRQTASVLLPREYQ